MGDPHFSERIGQFKSLILTTRKQTVFTGAGISAESGIPTYRGDDGIWNKYDPEKFANIQYFFKDPEYYWSFFRDVRYPVIKKAKPNKAHTALAEMEKRNSRFTLITQNIDGLHQEAGSQDVIELHGNTRRISCLDCGEKFNFDEVFEQIQHRLPPVCTECGGRLKPDVVFFGESLPADVLNAAIHASESCNLFIVIGSSLVVQPAASLPRIAKDSGAKLVIINKAPTPLDHMADIVFHESASNVLGQLY